MRHYTPFLNFSLPKCAGGDDAGVDNFYYVRSVKFIHLGDPVKI